MKNKPDTDRHRRFVASLTALIGICLIFLAGRLVVTDSSRYIFLLWNLILAAIPAVLAWGLVMRLKQHSWLGWQQLLLSILWLGFLPNSFYLVTDFVHLRPNYEADLLFDIILLSSFLLTGLTLGFVSVFLVHQEIIKRLKQNQAIVLVALIFLVSSFAVYLGRFTRWNSWDVLLRPAGLLFDVTDRFVNPAAHSQTYLVTSTMFLLLFSLYMVVWEGIQLLKTEK